MNVNGDFVGGNKVINQQAGGDIVGRDKVTTIHQGDDITVGPITNSTGIAIGHGAQSTVNQGVSGAVRRGALELADADRTMWESVIREVAEADRRALTSIDFWLSR